MSKSILPVLVFVALTAAGEVSAQSSVAHINGSAEFGNTVRIENIETNYSREVTVGKNGRFQFRSLPTGTYDVVIREPGGDIVKSQLVALRVGSTVSVKQGPRDAALARSTERQSDGSGDVHRERTPIGDAGTADSRRAPARDTGNSPQHGEPDR